MAPYRPIIGITMGDPVGIGPEIITKAWHDAAIFNQCSPFILGDEFWLKKAISVVGRSLKLNIINEVSSALFQPGVLDLRPVSRLQEKEQTWGKPSTETGQAMMAYVAEAVDLSLSGSIDAMVTCPINKKAMQQAGIDFPGHTEFLAEKTGASKIGMMLAGDRLRVVLATIHMPLRSVPEMLSTQKILDIIILADRELKERFGIKRPRLGVAGLNPHAGEEGMFGDEETRVILPAISKALAADIDISGPYPPDTVFYNAVSGSFDAVICMYHDQGLIPFKMVHFKDGVNTTLGLPIIRTSVDHGTAYDIAGTGKADPGSLLAAIKMAADQARHRHRAHAGK
jgi:4-hydroxythreonine-4-phosphate dehydrogenase